jgi:hypothetical protein
LAERYRHGKEAEEIDLIDRTFCGFDPVCGRDRRLLRSIAIHGCARLREIKVSDGNLLH